MTAEKARGEREGGEESLIVELPDGQRWELDGAPKGFLGQGRFGVVRRCFLLGEDAVGACKIVRKPSDRFDLECLENEIKIMQYLSSSAASSDSLVRLYGVRDAEEEENVHIVMELCSGGDLCHRIVENNERGCVFNELEAVEVIRQVMEAIAYCHSKGVAHRDLKPDNVLFVDNTSRHVKIADFGQSALFGSKGGMRGVVGTPYYVAPEILEGGEYTEKVDIWSAGIILYTMLCGYSPFRGDSPEEIFRNVLRCKLCFRSHLSASVKSLLRLMLKREPSARPSAVQVLEHPWLRV